MSEIQIQRVDPLQQLREMQERAGGAGRGGERFSELLKDALQEVNQLHQASDRQVEQVLSGDIRDVHSAMIAMQKADLSFQVIMQVRNKLVEAYQEVMRMQV